MAIHTIRMPDRLYGRDLRTIVWDDTAGTVEGDHSSVPGIAATLASPPPVDKSREGLVIFLDDPAHDPRDFLFMLADSYAAILDEPLRSTLPPVFDGIQHRAGVDWPDLLLDERTAAQSGFADFPVPPCRACVGISARRKICKRGRVATRPLPELRDCGQRGPMSRTSMAVSGKRHPPLPTGPPGRRPQHLQHRHASLPGARMTMRWIRRPPPCWAIGRR